MADCEVVFAVPGDLHAPTGGYAYARRLIAGLPDQGWQVTCLSLGDGYPDVDEHVASAACARLAAQRPGVPVMVDGLALGVLPALGEALRGRSPLVGLVHHPLALETGLRPARARALRDSERVALSAAGAVVATSRTTAETLVADYAVAASRLVVAPPGTDPAPFSAVPATPPIRLLSVGSLVPRKGHDVLLRALAGCAELPWLLRVVGDDRRDAATARTLKALASTLGIANRVEFTGAIDQRHLESAYAHADLFVLASRHEGYGMAGTEAVARGLPVVSTLAGAIPEALPAGSAWLVDPDDPLALREALAALIGEPARLRALASASRGAASGLHRWPETVRLVAGALQRAREEA